VVLGGWILILGVGVGDIGKNGEMKKVAMDAECVEILVLKGQERSPLGMRDTSKLSFLEVLGGLILIDRGTVECFENWPSRPESEYSFARVYCVSSAHLLNRSIGAQLTFIRQIPFFSRYALMNSIHILI